MTSTTGGLREVVTVVLAADSPAGSIATAIDDVTAHLPPPAEPWTCPLCSAQSWPCSRFDDAACRVLATGVRLADLVPLDLHPRLWPRPPGTQPPESRAPNRPSDLPSTWFDEESDEDEVHASSLRSAILRRLDYLDALVTDADLQSRAALADTEIARMTAAWRALLEQHQPDEDGRCPQCSGWRRPRKFPCSVWTTAHRHLVATDSPPAGGCGRHAFAGRRPSATVPAAS